MAVSPWIITTAILTCVVSHSNTEASNSHNRHNQDHPQKMVEIIELMLSQKPNNSEKRDFGIQKVPQEEPAGYSIFISPNKNDPEPQGSQKIKIFVEADDYDDKGSDMLPQETKTFTFVQPKSSAKQNIFEVLPLSIETAGVILDDYQKTHSGNVKTISGMDEISHKNSGYPSKRQTNTGTTQRPKTNSRTTVKVHQQMDDDKTTTTTRRETPRTTTTHRTTTRHILRDMDDNTRRTSTTYFDDKPKANSYGLGSTLVLTVPDEDAPISTSQIEPSYVDQNRPYQISVPKKETPSPLTYDSQFQKSSQMSQQGVVDTVYASPGIDTFSKGVQVPDDYNRPAANNGRKTQTQQTQYEQPYEERPTYNREPEKPTYSREPEKPTYNREPERPTYNREPERPSYNREPERPKETKRPVYEREPEDEYEREPEVTRPTRDQRPSYTDDSYDDPIRENRRPQYTQTTSNRPVRDNNYAGFPESFQPANGPAYSRPLQYEPARAFPASPCLQVFKYEGREPEDDRWYADIYVSTDEVLIGMRLDITLDRPADLLTNWISDVKTKDNVHFTILSLKKRLVPGPAESVRIMVKFDKNKPVPYLQTINLNGRRICPVRANSHSPPATRPTTRRPIYENPADLQTKRTTEYYPEGPKRPNPSFVDEYEQNTRRTTSQVYPETTRRTTPYNDRRTTETYQEDRRTSTTRPTTEYYAQPNPNPNGYEETDYNDFNRPTTSKKPTQTRPSNSKPSSSGTNSRPNNNNNKEQPKSIPCGKPSVQPRPLITNGQMTARGQWPWHVALYKNVGADLSYICGGSLISNQHVVTAAHCVTKPYDVKALDANILVVYLGKYHLKLWSEGGVQNKQVSEVHVHPSYNSTDFRADLAVLVLSSPVEFTEYIRPVCLWDKRSTRIEDIEGKEGTVIGWGFDETKRLTEDLMQAKMPVIKHDVCLWSYPQFFPQFTSNLTYCAGFKNGTSVCNGDSGGGMFFPTNDNNGEQRWHIRGLVSISVKQKDSVLCDLKHYIVFTDLAKFDTWLNNYVRD